MAGEGLVYLFGLILIWFLIFVLTPVGVGIFLLMKFKRRRSREAEGLDPKKNYRGKILLGMGIALIGFGVFVIGAQTVLTELDRQRIEDIANRPPSPAALEAG